MKLVLENIKVRVVTIKTVLSFIICLSYIATNVCFADQEYDLDEFDDLNLNTIDNSSDNSQKKHNPNKKMVLFEDNLYLLDDDFNFGTDEFELQKLELNSNDLETAKEYEDFLNAFFENTTPIGNKAYGSGTNKNSFSKKSKQRKSKKNRSSRSPSNSLTPTGRMGFGVSTIVGASIPMGQNLKDNFSSGSNFGIRLNTPVSFNIGSMEAKVGTDIYFSSMSALESSGSPYKLTNIVGNIGVFPIPAIKSLEIRSGFGISPSTIGDYGQMLFSIPVDVNYYLPFNLSGFRIAVNLHAQMTMGIPTDVGTPDSAGTSEFINVGFIINTPLVF